jgi:hypothetical protein
VWKGIGVPPSYGQLFGGVVEAVGVLGVLLVWVNRLRVRGLKPEVITRIAVGLVGTFVVSTVLYLFLFQLCVIDHPEYGSFYFPLWPTGELAWMIRETGGRFEAIHRYGLFPVERAILNTDHGDHRSVARDLSSDIHEPGSVLRDRGNWWGAPPAKPSRLSK